MASRIDLAACYRLTAMYGMTEMIATTSRAGCRGRATVPDQPLWELYEEIDASCLSRSISTATRSSTPRIRRQRRRLVIPAPFTWPSTTTAWRYAHAGRHGGLREEAGCCRWRNLDAVLHIGYHDFEASPTMSANASGWSGISAITKPWSSQPRTARGRADRPAAFNTLFPPGAGL